MSEVSPAPPVILPQRSAACVGVIFLAGLVIQLVLLAWSELTLSDIGWAWFMSFPVYFAPGLISLSLAFLEKFKTSRSFWEGMLKLAAIIMSTGVAGYLLQSIIKEYVSNDRIALLLSMFFVFNFIFICLPVAWVFRLKTKAIIHFTFMYYPLAVFAGLGFLVLTGPNRM